MPWRSSQPAAASRAAAPEQQQHNPYCLVYPVCPGVILVVPYDSIDNPPSAEANVHQATRGPTFPIRRPPGSSYIYLYPSH